MNPGRLTLPRIATMIAFALSCFGLLLFLWLSFGGPVPLKPKGYRVDVRFAEATQLADQADVRISGVSVGKVVGKRRDGDRTRATLELRSRFAPLPVDARATLRQKTLLGETFVELTPGSPGARRLREGETLPDRNVQGTVELDEVLRAFEPESREDLQVWVRDTRRAIAGRGRDLSDALGTVGPLAANGGDVLRTLRADRRALQRVVRDTGTVFETIGERDAAVREVVDAGAQVLRTTSTQREDLRATLRALPPLVDAVGDVADGGRALARDLVPASQALRPVARDLPATLEGGARLGDDLALLSRDLRPVVRAAEAGLPATRTVLRRAGPLMDRLLPAGQQLDPIVQFVDAYKADFTRSWPGVAAATNVTAPTAGGRPLQYLRLVSPIWNEAIATFTRRSPTNRANPYPAPGGLGLQGTGRQRAFDCAHTGNPQQVATLPGATGAPPCIAQEAFPVAGVTARFPQLRKAKP